MENINITIESEDGRIVFSGDCTNVDEAIAELGRYKRHVKPRLEKEAEEQKKSDLVDSLTPEQEEKLKEAHAEDYHSTDDDMSDAFEAWLENLTYEELHKII